ncbi:hypothetical protein MFLAVUS_007696 [Mucor flavus]|uniref:Uncharacterized protein n=1 Tax=Mucor flavus TaxID=439312 RepID=A0ABP9Z508_9FUNG
MVSASYASQLDTQDIGSSLARPPVKARLQGASRLRRRKCNKSTSTGSVDTFDNKKDDKISIDAKISKALRKLHDISDEIKTNPDNLTLGQASCLVLGLPPSIENRKISKEIIEETQIVEVSYKRRGDPFEPFLIGKKVKNTNPFLYKSYDVTPPLSPKFESDDHISIASTGSNGEEVADLVSQEDEFKKKERSDLSVLSEKTKDSASSSRSNESLEKELVIKFLKRIFKLDRPNQVHKYIFIWVDEKTQLKIVKAQFNLESLTAAKLETWISESGVFGSRIKRIFNDKNVHLGRYVYLLKQKYRCETTIL